MKRAADILPNYAVPGQPPVATDPVKYDNRAVAARLLAQSPTAPNPTASVAVDPAGIPSNQPSGAIAEGYAVDLTK